MKRGSKKAVSEVIASVLLILVVIAAAGVIYGFVMPLIKTNIEESQKCSSAVLEIDTESGYTCYDPYENEVSVEIKRSEKDVEITGIQLQVYSAGKSTSATIRNGTVVDGIREYSQTAYGKNLTIPKKNEANTYVIDLSKIGTPETVAVASLIKIGNTEKLCGASTKVAINTCA